MIIMVGVQELELLPVKELQNNIYIKHPVSMEQYLMEGSYNKVSQGAPTCSLVCVCVCRVCVLWEGGVCAVVYAVLHIY